jgi:hypothetical protein
MERASSTVAFVGNLAMNVSTRDAGTEASPDQGWGEQMLSYLLVVNDVITSAGTRTAAEWLTARDLAHAVAACRYFELDDLARVLLELPAAALGDGPARAVEERYRQLVPSDHQLAEAAERKRLRTPFDFEPPRS